MDSKYSTNFTEGAFPTPAIDPSVPISHPKGDALSSPFVDGLANMAGGGGGVTIPRGENIGNVMPGPISSPFVDGKVK